MWNKGEIESQKMNLFVLYFIDPHENIHQDFQSHLQESEGHLFLRWVVDLHYLD